MSAVPEQTLNWLYSVLTNEYVDVNRTYSDTAAAISHFRSFNPRTEVYTYPNGQSALLLQLHGLLPVTFRATVYRFPVTLWIPHAYPAEAPMVYVVPSQDMFVRPGQHVSVDGKVYHPYLAQWAQYWDRSSILDFMEILREVFAKEPPAISKQQAQSAGQQRGPQPPPVPPPPGQQPGPPTPALHANGSPVPPPKPPNPYTAHAPSPLRAQTSGGPPPVPRRPGEASPGEQPSYRPQPPIPGPSTSYGPTASRSHSQQAPHPAFQQQQYQQAGQGHFGSPVSPIAPNHGPTAHQNRLSQPIQSFTQHVPQQQAGQQYRPATAQQQRGQPHQGTYPPSQAYLPQQFPQHLQSQQYAPAQPAPKPKQPIPDLLDAPLDVTLPSQSGVPNVPAPPIPPNPEKDALLQALSATLVNQITSRVESNNSALPALQAQQSAMRTAHARLQSELDQLQQLDSTLASNERIIQDAVREADRVMQDARLRKAPNVDEILVAPTVVGGQLYNLCAEERACADAIFVLGRALDKGRLPADVFIKQTRSLAREQFLKKALIKKVARGMGLDDFEYGR